MVQQAIKSLENKLRKPGMAFHAPAAVADYLFLKYAAGKVERFGALYLDSKNKLIKEVVLSKGTVNIATVYPREIAKSCLRYYAMAVILFHNHPSGDSQPSMEDQTITRRLKSALELFDIRLHDHIILGHERRLVYSFADAGNL